jgi:hypothetical protein
VDPLRSESGLPESLSDTERDARIEQLLLAGLDEYFAGQYEDAVNLWTRVLFLDRHHDRARAYIERARRAEAERQRETDALLQEGMTAFHSGEVERARRLITDALGRGAAREDAQGMLDRIDRLGTGQTITRRRRIAAIPVRAGEIDRALPAPRRTGGLVAALLLVVAAVGALAVGLLGFRPLDLAAWPLTDTGHPPPANAISAIPMGSLPVAGASDSYLARGRVLFATGRLHDALAILDRVPIGDPQYAEAVALRVAVQRELLALAAAELSSPRSSASTLPPLPE